MMPRKVLVSLGSQYTQGINVKVISPGFSLVWDTTPIKQVLKKEFNVAKNMLWQKTQ